jgi:hypothetical protein
VNKSSFWNRVEEVKSYAEATVNSIAPTIKTTYELGKKVIESGVDDYKTLTNSHNTLFQRTMDGVSLASDVVMAIPGVDAVGAGVKMLSAGIRGGEDVIKTAEVINSETKISNLDKNTWQIPEHALEKMTEIQAKNLYRFLNKLPQNSTNIRVKDFLNGGKVFQADSPAANILGSYAKYEKQIDEFGDTVLYTKTTIDR